MTSIALIVASWAVVSIVVAFGVAHVIKMADRRAPARTATAAASSSGRPDQRFGVSSDAGSGLLTAG